jgi:2-C-methyl-D-erythritol 4-phosphate cytidylyltransferase
MKTTAIILAGGKGSRFKGKEPKQFLKIGTRTMLDMCLQPFQKHKGVQEIILVCPKEHLAQAKKIAGHYSKVAAVVAGGKTRQGSSANGLAAAGEAGQILIHDAARALVADDVIDRVLKALAKNAAVMPVLPSEDTTVRVDDKGSVTAVLDRDKLRRVQTPQGFRADIIRIAHRLAQDEGFADAPDDCSLILRYGLAPIASVAGDPQNIKITYPSDLEIARAFRS